MHYGSTISSTFPSRGSISFQVLGAIKESFTNIKLVLLLEDSFKATVCTVRRLTRSGGLPHLGRLPPIMLSIPTELAT